LVCFFIHVPLSFLREVDGERSFSEHSGCRFSFSAK
jgi:hypothetical protein